MSVAMALAESNHRAAPRGQKMARAREEDNEVHFTAMIRASPPLQAVGTENFALEVDDVPAAGSRPDRLFGVRPQEWVQRHTVEQIGDSAPYLPSLDVPVQQMAKQLLEVFKLLDSALSEQVIAVPKISHDSIQQCLVDRDLRHSHMAEPLVEVPTVLSLLSLQQQIPEQIVDIPVPPLMVIMEVFKVFPLHEVRSVLLSRSLTFLLVVVFKIFSLILVQPHPQSRVVFRTFPVVEKVRSPQGGPSARVPGSSSSWTPVACEAHHVGRGSSRVRPRTKFRSSSWKVCKAFSLDRAQHVG